MSFYYHNLTTQFKNFLFIVTSPGLFIWHDSSDQLLVVCGVQTTCCKVSTKGQTMQHQTLFFIYLFTLIYWKRFFLFLFYDLEHLPLWSRDPVITVTGVSNLAKLSPCPSCPCSPWPQLHTSVCRVGSTSWSSGMAPPSGVRATARILGRPAFLSSRGDTAGVKNREVCPLHI